MKFDLEPDNVQAKRKLAESYLQGLAWVLTYYHDGCGSWTWYYPYLYGPLATDLRNLADLDITFEQGSPFTPLLQLLSVLPPQSGDFLPPSYREAMTSSVSPLVEYYPRDFEVDANGKKNSWECIVKIPFINETILVDTVSTIDHKKELTLQERTRNIPGETHRFRPPNPQDPEARRKQSPSMKGWGSALKDDAPKRRYGTDGPRQAGAGGPGRSPAGASGGYRREGGGGGGGGAGRVWSGGNGSGGRR